MLSKQEMGSTGRLLVCLEMRTQRLGGEKRGGAQQESGDQEGDPHAQIPLGAEIGTPADSEGAQPGPTVLSDPVRDTEVRRKPREKQGNFHRSLHRRTTLAFPALHHSDGRAAASPGSVTVR